MTHDPTSGPEHAWAARRAAAQHRRSIRFNALAHALSQGRTPQQAVEQANFPSLDTARKQLRAHGQHGLANQLNIRNRGGSPVTRNDTDMDRIEDFEFCLNTGEWPERAWKRANFVSADEAREVFESRGRFDLAHRLVIEPVTTEEDLVWV